MPNENQRKPLEYRLLKSKKVKDGKTYNNIYLQFKSGDEWGHPIAIDLVRWNIKVRNLILSACLDFEVERKLKVSAQADENGVISEEVPENKSKGGK